MSVGTRRVAVITGASSGIGREAAKSLASQGWRIIATGRDPVRSTAAEAEIRSASSTGRVDMLRADLSLLADVVRVAGQIAALTDRVDVLINNAGGMSKARVVTAEGLEENFAGNHLGPFLLTKKLLPLLHRAAADSPRGSVRIINTSSDAGEMIKDMPWDDLQLLARGAFSVSLQQMTMSALANCEFPGKTPNEPDRWNWIHCQVRLSKKRNPAELIMPDLSGEAILEEVDLSSVVRRDYWEPSGHPLQVHQAESFMESG